MKLLVLLSVACATALAAPEGYGGGHKEPAPVVEHGNLNGFQPIGFPCTHASHHAGDSVGAAAALIQSQSTGRILNHPHHQHHHEEHHSLEAAASGIHSQSQAVTVNSHIVVGDSGSAASSVSGASQEFHAGQGYVQGQQQQQQQQQGFQQQQLPAVQSTAPQFNPLPQLPPQLPAQPFNPAHLVPGKVVPSQVLGGQTQGYVYSQAASQGAQHVHHHFTLPVSGPGAIVNGVGKVPPPPVYFAPGNKFSGPPATSYGAPVRGPSPVFGGPAPYRPAGPVAPGPVGNVGAPRPVQHFGGSAGFQQGSSAGSYAGSFGHSTHGAQFVQTQGAQFAGGASGHFGATGAGASQFGSSHSGSFGSASTNFGSSSASHAGSFSSGSSGLFGGASSASGILSGQLGHVIRETFANAPLDPAVEKHIYVHVPPEDLEENAGKHAAATVLPQAPPKKHYKIIFIKAPTVAQPNYAQLAAAAAPQTEEKTLVYVLVKKPDEPSLEEIQQIQQAAVKPSKPEVYFIKYKTRKEGDQQQHHQQQFQQHQQQFQAGGDQFGALNQFSNVGGYSSGGAANVDAGIDLRLGSGSGSESSSVVSTSASYSSSATASASSSSASSTLLEHGGSEGPKHELYGVPLE